MNEKSFLGQGWSFPPTFVKDLNNVVLSEGDENIRQNLDVLLRTTMGERTMEFGFGTQLKKYVFGKNTSSLIGRITKTVTNAILLYEPRIKLLKVQIDDSDRANGVLKIDVLYEVRTTNNRANFVHPFHFLEGTSLKK